jgi:hypothetical protein
MTCSWLRRIYGCNELLREKFAGVAALIGSCLQVPQTKRFVLIFLTFIYLFIFFFFFFLTKLMLIYANLCKPLLSNIAYNNTMYTNKLIYFQANQIVYYDGLICYLFSFIVFHNIFILPLQILLFLCIYNYLFHTTF